MRTFRLHNTDRPCAIASSNTLVNSIYEKYFLRAWARDTQKHQLCEYCCIRIEKESPMLLLTELKI